MQFLQPLVAALGKRSDLPDLQMTTRTKVSQIPSWEALESLVLGIIMSIIVAGCFGPIFFLCVGKGLQAIGNVCLIFFCL